MSQCEELKDEERPTNTLELFTEVDDVMQMIETVKGCDAPGFEKDYQRFSEILSRYQEQPHLLDPHIERMLQHLLDKIRQPALPEEEMHARFKYLYVISKVRTHKVLVRFLPHELSDLEFALELIERQDEKDFYYWETRYMLLLWMSILVLNPFHMARLDVYVTEGSAVADGSAVPNNTEHVQPISKMERIFNLCKRYSDANDTCSNMAAFLAAKYLVRTDVKDMYLPRYLDWVMSCHQADTVNVKFGQLAAVAAILKHGKREDLLPYAEKLLRWIVTCDYTQGSDFLKYKYYIKIIQRIGLIYLKPRVASWRYQRGTRSLAINLTEPSSSANSVNSSNPNNPEELVEGEEIVVPDSIEEVIEELLQGLRSSCGIVRWSAAKGIGRVTDRLSRELADEVIGSTIDVLNPLEPAEAWHGGCLAIAELAKRGLLLPYRLRELVPLLMQALFYDELKGYMSVGRHIRDSACYMCWAFARAYNPEDLEPFVQQISSGLVTVAVFDREINCRRSASAAFQESVGRLGNFPHGIEILTATDFYSVGLRQNSFLHISDFIAQYEEYRVFLIDHLLERKVIHWDTAIRELTAKALNVLTFRAPQYMLEVVLGKLFGMTDSIDVNIRHGSVLAIGEITLALRQLEQRDPKATQLSNQMTTNLNELLGKFLERNLFRGVSGEMMKQCCMDFVRNCSLAEISVTPECLGIWQQLIDKCLVNKKAPIREAATAAFAQLCKTYYIRTEYKIAITEIIRNYLKGADSDVDEHARMGYVSALGVLPQSILLPRFGQIVDNLIKHSLAPPENAATSKWSEARRDSVKALSNVIDTIGFKGDDTTDSFGTPKHFNRVIDCLVLGMDEYTVDNRGDIGAWVREAAMNAVYELLASCPKKLLEPTHVDKILACFMQQSVEKIDRTRGLAGRLFCNLIHIEPSIPYIKHHARLREIFPEDSSEVLWLFADHTCPLFCSLLEFPEYSKPVLLGLSASIGQLTETLVKHSSAALFQFLRAHPTDVPRLCQEIVQNFEENLLKERVTGPMLYFLEILISSGTIGTVLLDESTHFADEIYRLLNLEIKGHKKLYKLVASISVFCQLVQVPHISKKVLSKMAVFLGLTHVHVRKMAATKLYEALALHGDACDIPEEQMEEILTKLSETDWGLPLVEVRPIRNELCALMGIKAPVSGVAAGTALPTVATNA